MQRTAGCLMAFAAVALAIPDSRRALQATAGTALNVPTNGASVPSEITTTGGNEWFKFTAQAGHTYQVHCRPSGQLAAASAGGELAAARAAAR